MEACKLYQLWKTFSTDIQMSFFSKDSRMDQWLAAVSQREGPGFKSTNRLGPLVQKHAWVE